MKQFEKSCTFKDLTGIFNINFFMDLGSVPDAYELSRFIKNACTSL